MGNQNRIKLHDKTIFRVFQWLKMDPGIPESFEVYFEAFKNHFDNTVESLREYVPPENRDKLPDYRIDPTKIGDNESRVRHSRRRILVTPVNYDWSVPIVDAYTQLDMYYYYFAIMQKGESHPDESNLTLPLIALPSEHEAFIGDGYILYAEIQDFQNHGEKEFIDVATDYILSSIPECQKWKRNPDFISKKTIYSLMDYFFLAFTSIDECNVATVLVSREAVSGEAKHTINEMVYIRVMDMLLSLIRLSRIYKFYENYLRLEIYKDEKQLNLWLNKLSAINQSSSVRKKKKHRKSKRHVSLNELEEIMLKVFEEQNNFMRGISRVYELINAAKIAIRNFVNISEDAPINDPELSLKFEKKMKFMVEQMEEDLKFFDITRKQAELALSNLQTRVNVEENRAARVLAVFFGIFAIFEIIQAFPEIPIIWRGVIIFGGLGILWYLVKYKFDTLLRLWS